MDKAKVENILITKEEIDKRITELGEILAKDYKDKDPLVIGLLNGASIFMSDLVRAMDIKLEMGFITTASYGHSETSSGHVAIINDVQQDVKGRHILLVDDIIDSGRTLNVVKEMLKEREPESIKVVTLLDKPSRRVEDIQADHTGFVIEDLFVVGYGLNFERHYRNVPYIFTFDK